MKLISLVISIIALSKRCTHYFKYHLFAATSLTLTPSRAKGIDYLIPLAEETMALTILNNGRQSLNWRLYSMPFTLDTWLALFIGIAISSVFVKVLKE